jgi:hypothetical protein
MIVYSWIWIRVERETCVWRYGWNLCRRCVGVCEREDGMRGWGSEAAIAFSLFLSLESCCFGFIGRDEWKGTWWSSFLSPF